MEWYCDVCDNTIKNIRKSKYFQSLTHIEFENCLQTKHIIQNPDSFDIS